MIATYRAFCIQSNLSVTVELQDVNDSPYFEDVETEIFVEVS